MYVIRYKKTEEIVFISSVKFKKMPSPKALYPLFDDQLMEMGWTDESGLPSAFKIDKQGVIRELSLSEKIKKGHITLSTSQRIKNGKIVDKTLKELVEEGVIKLNEKDKMKGDKIVEKSLAEQIKEGIISITPYEKLEGNQIKPKSFEEVAKEGLVKLNFPFRYAKDNDVASFTVKELWEEGRISSMEDIERAIRRIDFEIEQAVKKEYRRGGEIRILKDFVEFVYEGKPKNDTRETAYLEMEERIAQLKKENLQIKSKLQERLEELKSQ